MNEKCEIYGRFLITDYSEPVIRKLVEIIQRDSKELLDENPDAVIEVMWRATKSLTKGV